MAWRLVKQPNGLYARFADPIDHFTHYNMTREEAIKMCRDEYDFGKLAAEKKVANADEDRTELGAIGRFAECVETIRILHGDKEAEKVKGWFTSPLESTLQSSTETPPQ